jgi:azurin
MKVYKILLICFLAICCNESNETGLEKQNAPISPANGHLKKELEITVKALGNTMAELNFEPKEINVPTNSKIKINLRNESSVVGMNHNMVIVNMGKGGEVATAAIEAGEANQFIPSHPDLIAASPMLLPGENRTFEFETPPIGSYHFICTYPGHFPQMVGRLNVVEKINQ